MTMYVDPLFSTTPSKKWPYTQACHLTCSGDVTELHAFAHKLGLKRVWFQGQQNNPVLWHYDLTANKRLQALRLGAIAITRKQRAEQLFQERETMEKTSYTVKVDGQTIEIDAYGTYSAATNAVKALCITNASKVTVIAGNGERASYRNAQRDAMGFLSYERKE